MSLPTLIPVQSGSVTILSATGSVNDVAGALPLGIYASSDSFISGAADQVAYTYKHLGGDVLDLEITDGNVYAAYETAVLDYSYLVNIHQAKNALGSYLGGTTGSFDEDGQLVSGDDLVGADVALKFPKFRLIYERQIGNEMSTQAGYGGTQPIYSGSIDIVTGQQDYDLQAIVSASAALGTFGYTGDAEKRIVVTRLFYKTPHAMWRFYGYYGGLNTVGNLSSYGQFTDDSSFEIIPVWQNLLQARAFEDAIYTRNSHYSYEIKNNKVRLYPQPVDASPNKFWFHFYVLQDNDAWENTAGQDTGQDGINNMNTLPFENIPYASINSIGKQWIRRYALALSKCILGETRSKFGTIPIPGESVTLNGEALKTEGKEEKDKLRDELKEVLDEMTYVKLMENNKTMSEMTEETMKRSPLPVFVG